MIDCETANIWIMVMSIVIMKRLDRGEGYRTNARKARTVVVALCQLSDEKIVGEWGNVSAHYHQDATFC